VKRIAYSKALATFESTEGFAEPLIREVLILYCRARVVLATMERLARSGIVPAADMPQFESACRELVSIVLEGQQGTASGLAARAVRVPRLSGARAFGDVVALVERLRLDAAPESKDHVRRVEQAFDGLQGVLPSYTFLTTGEGR